MQGMKATLRKLFNRRSGHQRLPDEDMLDAEEQHPTAAPAQQAQQSSFSFGR